MLEIARGHLAEAEGCSTKRSRIAREHKHWMLGQVLTNVGDLDVRQRRLESADKALDEARDSAGCGIWRRALRNGRVAPRDPRLRRGLL